MPKPASVIADEVASRARGLNSYVLRMEGLHADGKLSTVDVRRVHAGALISFQAFVEQSLERLFMGILMGRFTAEGTRSMVRIESEVVARKVMGAGRNYATWIPYDTTERRAKAFLSRGMPFSSLEKADRRVLNDLSTLRNALAHESAWALNQFRKTFTDGKGLPPDQLMPAGYLRGSHNPGQSRFSYHLAEAVGVFKQLCT